MLPSFIARPASSRALHLVLVTMLLGAVLAVAPRPAFAVERGARVDSETPDLVPVTADRDDTVSEPGGIEAAPADEADAAPTDEPVRLGAEANDIDEFQMIGASFDADQVDDGRLRISIDGRWEPWQPLTGLDGDHGPDAGTAEAQATQAASDPVWVGAGDGYELDLPADASDVEVHLVRETEERVRIVEGTAEAGAHRMPTVRSRGSWGARNPKRTPQIAGSVDLAVIHHTVNSNSYSSGSVPAMLRSIQAFHMDANGWDDIGYNFVVDRFGRTWEGRSRSTYEAVVGAHTSNYNTGSTGVAWLGNSSTGSLTAAGHEAIAQVIAWKLPLHGTFFTGSQIVGHRDRQSTECPGTAVYGQLGSIRNRALQVRPPPGPYLDVPDTAWNGPEISWGKFIGIATGFPDGNFQPRANLSRAQLVNMLYGLAGTPPATTRHGFTDVARSSWLTPALDWARQQGIITGFPDGSFRGDNTVRRDSIAVLLWRWATSPVSPTSHGFTDIAPGSWADEALKWAKATGVADGYPNGTYGPSRNILRGQLLPMLFEVRPFTDVPATAWYQPGAHWGLHQRVSLGYSDRTFRGQNQVLRDQATSMLWRTMDAPTVPAPPPHGWPDVAGGAWYTAALDWATQNGVVDGRPDGQFHGSEPLLRHETVLWVWRAAGSPAATTSHGLSDVPGGAPYEDALDWAVEHGVMSGFPDGTFHPDDEVNREQWMMTLHRLASTPGAWVGGATPPTTTLF